MCKHLYHYFLIERSGLFDEAYYLFNYPDVRSVDTDPLMHFIKHGWKEGRNPSEDFETAYYLSHYKDVQASGMNPLLHYIKHGRNEGRQPNQASSNGLYEFNFVVEQKRIDINLINKEQPLVSIIIPVYNALDYTKACIQSLYCNHINHPFEVIVVDNGSKEPTRKWLKSIQNKYQNLSCIFLDKNLGFSPAVNVGINQSQGNYIVILNNDTITTPGWLDKLYQAFLKDPDLGIASPTTNYVGEGIQIDPDACDVQPDAVNDYAQKIADHEEIRYDPIRLVFFCVMIRRPIIDLVGSLDEGYIRGNFEDDDYCLRVRLLGYKLGVVANSFVYHYGSITFKEHNFEYTEHYEENRSKFYGKVGRLATNKPLSTKKVKLIEQDRVSVIVRTVNRPELLNLALNSLVNQTRKPDEIIVVNDGGPDILEKIKQFRELANIQYFRHEPAKGRTAALNVGLAASTGDWLTILDDDDIYYPWHLESMLDAVNKEPEIHFFYGCHNRVLIDSEVSINPIIIKGQPPFIFSRNYLLLGNMIPINTWFFSKAIFEDLGGFDESFDTLEDYDFLLKVSEKYPLELVDKTICEYRFYLAQANSIVRFREDSLTALQRIYDRYPANNQEMELEREQLINQQRTQYLMIEQLQDKLQTCPEDEKKNIYLEMLSIVGAF